MTAVDLLRTCHQRGILLAVTPDGYIDIDAPAGAVTPDFRAELVRHKPTLLAVLWRLDGMRQHPEPIPTARSAHEAPGGPGRCFSCGDRHEHPAAYGRCTWCALAAEAYYAQQHADEDGIMVAADAPQGRPA